MTCEINEAIHMGCLRGQSPAGFFQSAGRKLKERFHLSYITFPVSFKKEGDRIGEVDYELYLL
jgi:hypothetical protein